MPFSAIGKELEIDDLGDQVLLAFLKADIYITFTREQARELYLLLEKWEERNGG